MTDSDFMRMAIRTAREGLAEGQTPFGACIVRDGTVLSCAHNEVWSNTDITAHAEVEALREACRRLRSIDLSGSVIYSTCEPCPMCFSACHWAGVSRIVFGAGIPDAAAAGFRELAISCRDMNSAGGAGIEIVSGILRDECVQLFADWRAHAGHRAY